MARLSSIRLDNELEDNGKWVPWLHGIELRIARMNTPRFQERMRELSQAELDRVRDGNDEVVEDVTKQVIAEMVWLGWRNIEDDNGDPLEYSVEQALEILQDPAFRDLYGFILSYSYERENFLVESSAKNSQSASSGPSGGDDSRHG